MHACTEPHLELLQVLAGIRHHQPVPFLEHQRRQLGHVESVGTLDAIDRHPFLGALADLGQGLAKGETILGDKQHRFENPR